MVNMDWEEFAGAGDEDGVFRGFGASRQQGPPQPS
jgi:uncharacterized protein DUF6924